jgi:putative ABC transport system ATP-binding protein
MAEPILSEAYGLLDGAGLVRDFPSGDAVVRVLRGVDLAVAEGTIVAVTGRSGAGKTTLLNILGGLDRATSGQVRLDGVDVGAMDERALIRLRRETVAYAFQALSLVATLSAAENVEIPLRLLRVASSERDERVAAALDDVGLLPRAGHRPGELSGGEQQRVAIARALVGRARLLLADEPTAQLDHDTSRAIASLLRRRVELDGLTIVLASHDPVLLAIADEVYELREGRLEATDHPDR